MYICLAVTFSFLPSIHPILLNFGLHFFQLTSELERLKEEVSLVRLVETSGLELKRTGKDYVGSCPFHEDSTPSLVITPAKNLFHCFGCGAAGGVVDWVMKTRGISFRHAVEILRNDPSLAAGDGKAIKQGTVPVLPSPVALEADDQAALDQVMAYYHATLKNSPNALAYLSSRGLSHPDVIDTFKLGYANRTLGLRLPDKNRKAGAELRTRLEKVGIYRHSGHEHFSGSLVIPVLDMTGHVREVYGRKVIQNLRPGTPMHLYLPGAHEGVWNEAGVADSGGEVILCEALMDALTFWCAGYRNVTASYGVEGFTAAHGEAFERYGIKRVLIAYDRDEAGERGAMKVAESLMQAGIECYRIQFPKGMDANEYALKMQPADKALGLLIRKAVWLGKGTAPQREEREERLSVAAEPSLPRAAKEKASTIEMPEEAACAVPVSLPEPVEAPPIVALSGTSEETAELKAGVSDDEVRLHFGEGVAQRRWRIRGVPKNLSVGILKVNVMVSSEEAFHVDTLDLYAARARGLFIQQAAAELQVKEAVLKTELGRVLLKLEALQEESIQKALIPQNTETALSEAEQAEALAWLQAPRLLERILEDFEQCGVVGENTNKLIGYLAATSRLLERPLAVLIQSSSAAGKSALMESILAFLPDEGKVKYSAMTGQSLFYMGETNLKHKVLAIAEEEGASRASYALKLLQSEGELTIASTGSDANGTLVTQEYHVEGPMSLFMTTTTTAIDIDEELMNRCLVLSVDEGREQTRAIHARQRARRTLAGLQLKEQKQDCLRVHQNVQRLLRPLAVVNPYAEQLGFMDDRTRTRRDHEKYLSLIDTIALLHQYQRPIKTLWVKERCVEYIEVSVEDIEQANRLAHEVLGRSLDEVPPQTRHVLGAIQSWVHEAQQSKKCLQRDIRFSRSDVRQATGLSDKQCRVHLERLTELEYLLVHRGKRGQCFEYELLFDGNIGSPEPRLTGLIEASTLKPLKTEATSQGVTPMMPTSWGEHPSFVGLKWLQRVGDEGKRATQLSLNHQAEQAMQRKSL